ncbi:alpha/beta hydrolase [Paenibacillus sp. 1011MAR3C5]|uniref:alpha/beta hydrolase n=1 Tax=Paenibacillus sp. 1011MAR3C5 TaxID=1675787 RepID=UPI000E6D0919|nr:alpha/beta hydrolase [Paenibacillus sp. 1011MAR3C5]RJE88759.1 alpha/beta hydrolase [Paenibacillus sp. 1011MAR3C5]
MFITIIVLVLAAGIIGASFYFYNVAIARADKSFLNGNPDLEVGASAENPYERNDQWWEAQPFEEWSMESEDGLRLHAYYLEASQPSDITVIIAHGYSGHAALMTNFAQMYSEKLGYNVLLPDARGHGRSGGRYIGFGWPERRDYVGWIRKVIEKNGGQSQLILHGVSMGGATVMMTSGESLPRQVKAIIEDCGYTSAKKQLAYQLKRMYKLPSFPLLQTTSLVTKWRAGYSFSEASALEQVKKSKTPILFIHGDTDLFVPTAMVNELYEQGPEQKELLIIPGAGHGLARHIDPETYDRAVIGFIKKYVH